jgi:hypothetical protein
MNSSFGNVPQVSVHLSAPDDSGSSPLDGSKSAYMLAFSKGQCHRSNTSGQ